MLSHASLEKVLRRIPELTVGVLGDLFLDRYLEIDADLTEPSLETGLDAYQVVGVRASPGAAGTVLCNLLALGVSKVVLLTVIGADGEGYELLRALVKSSAVDIGRLIVTHERRTPTYTKPMLHEAGRPPRELNRLDIKNRSALPAEFEDRLVKHLTAAWPRLDALIVLDQVSEPECGVVTSRVRTVLAELAQSHPERLILADSRERIGCFHNVTVKPNRRECKKATGTDASQDLDLAARRLAELVGRAVFCTDGADGVRVATPDPAAAVVHVPAYPVTGPIDVVGAGDSTSAGIACALAAGTSLAEAAAFGNLVASITIQQLGTTGTASPREIRERWRETQQTP